MTQGLQEILDLQVTGVETAPMDQSDLRVKLDAPGLQVHKAETDLVA